MNEKLTLFTKSREKTPFVTRGSTVSDDLKARTLAAMAQREQENKGKIKSIRQMPKLALVAAIIILTLLVATGAAYALRYWFEDVFEVDQTQTVNGYTLSIERARLSSDFLFLDLHSEDDAYICFEGTLSNDNGDTVDIYSENSWVWNAASTFIFYAPDIKNIVNSTNKGYHCQLTAYYYTPEKYKKRTAATDHSDADAVFPFEFDIANDYVKSVKNSKAYDINYSVDLDGITLDFQKYYATDAESLLMVEVIRNENTEVEFNELYIKARVIDEKGENSKGYFYNPYYETVTVGAKQYLLLPYSYDNQDGYTYIHYMMGQNQYDDDGHNAEREYERLSFEPPFKIEIESIEWQTYEKNNRKEIYTKLKDIDIPVKYTETDIPIDENITDNNILVEINRRDDNSKTDDKELSPTQGGDNYKGIDFQTSDGKAAYYFGNIWNYYDEDENKYYPHGLFTEITTKTDKSPYWDILKESGYVILAGFKGKKEVLKCKMECVFSMTNDTRMEGGTGFRNGSFTVSTNPLNKNYIKHYYDNKSLDTLDVVFYQDISKWLDPDAESTEINFNKICMDMGVDHFKVIGILNYVDFCQHKETFGSQSAQMYYETGADVDYGYIDEDNRIHFSIRDKIERMTYIFTNPKYFKGKISPVPIYDTVPHYIAKERSDYIYYDPERKWTAEEFTFTVK